MKSPRTWLALLGLMSATLASANPGTERVPSSDRLVNSAIDMSGFLDVSRDAARHRETRRITEDQFLRLSREPGTLVLDARSREKYDELHVAGAVNLSFPDIAIGSLQRLIPDKQTLILIYCNNNFRNGDGPFPGKMAMAALNLSTYVSLYTYGYRNVYELGPELDIEQSILPFESTRITRQ